MTISLITKEQGESFGYTIAGGIFLAAQPEQGVAAGVLLPSNGNLSESQLESATSLFESYFRLGRAQLSVKVVGIGEEVERAAAFLRRLGFKVQGVAARDHAFDLQFFPEQARVRISKQEKESVEARKIKVMIVDDSKTIHTLLRKIFAQDPTIEIVAGVENPLEAEAAVRQFKPDVITMDIQMPHKDGVSLVRELVPKFSVPIVMISAMSMEDGTAVLDALEAGAIDYIQKPVMEHLQELAPLIVEKIKVAAKVKIKQGRVSSARTVLAKRNLDQSTVVAIGSSTGGIEALKEILIRLPANIPPVVIVQHIPAVFSRAVAERFNSLCKFDVKEAEDNDEVIPNRVLIAPGGTQMQLIKSGGGFRVRIDPSAPPCNRHKPSVDVLFDSVALHAKGNAVGIILTGMGADGARGLRTMRDAGARTLGQDEATCVVYGMPQAAVKQGAVERSLPLQEIAEELLCLLEEKQLKVRK
jgi:two-component system, chemotaxis family, protein-glutamate methylesterase/glutaminase